MSNRDTTLEAATKTACRERILMTRFVAQCSVISSGHSMKRSSDRPTGQMAAA